MRDDIERRVIEIARAMIRSGATVRTLAREYGVSKSTVHKDMTQRLKRIDPGLFAEVGAVLRLNKSERHIRGGRATSQKYRLRRERLRLRQATGNESRMSRVTPVSYTPLDVYKRQYLYYSMLYAVSGDWDNFLAEGVLTLSTAAAIAVGMMVGSSRYASLLALKHALSNDHI